jgi:hypothetical protein
MTERTTRKRRPDGSKARPPRARPQPARSQQADESERSLGRAVAFGLPAVALAVAVVVGLVAGFGSALLILAAGALLGAIALLWASVRTLSGDAPLPAGFEGTRLARHGVDDLAERKLRVLRALKDLEGEHALGKIDDADYRAVSAKYRDEAKAVMRKMDLEIAPRLEEAERLAQEYLAQQSRSGDAAPPAEPSAASEDRSTCRSCSTSNEADAAFCKQCGASMSESRPTEKVDAPG